MDQLSMVWFGKSARSLCACCKEKLVARASGASESKAVEFEDALEVGEEHLDLLA
jgi:hypothetical protein